MTYTFCGCIYKAWLLMLCRFTAPVKPDKITVEKTSESTVNWTYPRTWSLPRSYFPLTFQVKVVPQKKHCNYEAGPGEVEVMSSVSGFLAIKPECQPPDPILQRPAWASLDPRMLMGDFSFLFPYSGEPYRGTRFPS